MRTTNDDVCGCFPTGRHYPGIADLVAADVPRVEGLASEFDAGLEWRDARLAVIDFETTGLDAANDRVLEMGIACFERGELVELKNWLINPGIPVPEEARAVHGISDDELRGAPLFDQVLAEAMPLLRGCLPAAYNAEFDRRFLHAEYARLSIPDDGSLPPALRSDVVWIDPLVWVRELQKYEKGKKLTDVTKRMGIKLDQAHRAAGDSEAAGRVLIALAPNLPKTYGELVRIQKQYGARQEAELAAWRSRRGG